MQSTPVGYMRNIRVHEDLQRGRVQGLETLLPKEFPALSWAGTVSCDFYNIDFSISIIPQAIFRNVQTYTDWMNSIILQQQGVTIDIFQTAPANGAPLIGLIPSQETPYATIGGLYLNSENFDISEGQVSGRNQTFQYLFPIIYPV